MKLFEVKAGKKVFSNGWIAELKKLEAQIDDVNNNLYEKFFNYYDVNKWTPKSGFENPLDFYIHETTKRDLKITGAK